MRARMLGFAGMLVACSGPDVGVASRRSTTAALLGIAPRLGEVWAHELTLRGEAPTAPLARCRVSFANGQLDAQVDGTRWIARVPIASGENRIDVACDDVLDRAHRSPTARITGMLRERRLPERPPIGRAARDSVVYGVVPPLFGTPPLRAVTASIPELADLGVDVLWLAPIFENAPRDYGYAVTNHLRVRPDYGTQVDLAELVEAAHLQGLRVVLDFVPNHTSTHHRYFEEALALGRASHYWTFYDRGRDGAPTHYFDWEHLPNLDYRNQEVARWMLETARRWVEDVGIDGYRIDAAWAVQERAPLFFDELRRELRAVDERLLLFAEASARDPFWRAHGYDAGYDWTDQPGDWSWKAVFDDPERVADRLDEAVRSTPPSTLRFLENNDTGPRFVTRHGAGMARAAVAALLTLPGIPVLFTGGERGAEFEPYERSSPLDRADPQNLVPHHQRLIALRHELPALRSDEYVRAQARDPRVVAFARGGVDDDGALVALRFDSEPAHARVVLPEHLLRVARWRDAETGEAVLAERGVVVLHLGAWAARVLVPAP